MRPPLLLLVLVMLRGAACTAPRRSAAACPDEPVMHCLTARTCAWDARRNCEVCRCADAPYRTAESPQGAPRTDPVRP
ncbi:MAG: hypothetical protein U0325_07645 [Polyangiales bacterium]